MGVSLRTAKKYGHEWGLPVTRLGGPMVVTSRGLLDMWLLNHAIEKTVVRDEDGQKVQP